MTYPQRFCWIRALPCPTSRLKPHGAGRSTRVNWIRVRLRRFAESLPPHTFLLVSGRIGTSQIFRALGVPPARRGVRRRLQKEDFQFRISKACGHWTTDATAQPVLKYVGEQSRWKQSSVGMNPPLGNSTYNAWLMETGRTAAFWLAVFAEVADGLCLSLDTKFLTQRAFASTPASRPWRNDARITSAMIAGSASMGCLNGRATCSARNKEVSHWCKGRGHSPWQRLRQLVPGWLPPSCAALFQEFPMCLGGPIPAYFQITSRQVRVCLCARCIPGRRGRLGMANDVRGTCAGLLRFHCGGGLLLVRGGVADLCFWAKLSSCPLPFDAQVELFASAYAWQG